MHARETASCLLLILVACLLAPVALPAQESAWEEYLRRNPAAVDDESVDPLMRKVLHALSPEQAAELYDGADPSEIVFDDGGTLADLLADLMVGGPGLVFVPVDLCRVFATSAQTAPVSGKMSADEVRGYVVRGGGMTHTDQGGQFTCLIPPEAVAVVTHFRVVSSPVADARGFLRVWPADEPEPPINLLDYEPTVDPPLAPRVRFNLTAVVELCPTGVCLAGGEFKVKTGLLGAHVRGDVSGYFRPIQAADVPGAGDADTLDGLDSTDFALASHTHDGGDITSGTVGEPYIDPAIARDSEVVDIVKDNDGSGTGIDADLLDGRDSTDLMLQVGNCLTVSSSCPVAASEALAARCWQTIGGALGVIGSDLPAASPSNRYVIQVGPGTYTEQVNMIPNVDIEGSGQKVTTITNTTAPTVAAASDTVMSALTVENTNGGVAIQASGSSPRLEHLTARSTGAVTSIGVKLGMGAAPTLKHVTTASDGDGVENNAAAVTVRDSVLAGAVNGIRNVGAGAGASKIVNTQIEGGADDGATGSTFSCLGAYDETFAALDGNCQ